MLPDLEIILNYENKRVLRRYELDYPNASLSAHNALRELMKFMWLSLKHQADKNNFPHEAKFDFVCAIHDEMVEIDAMWHTFLLFTRDYRDFCQRYLGNFFHHQPTLPEEKILSDEDYERELNFYLSYIYDHLGESTLIEWFGCK